MNEYIVKDVFSVYEVLKDSIKVARRSINKELYKLHGSTVFLGEQKNEMLNRLSVTEEELEDIMVLSLFASFERELRLFIQEIVDGNMSKPTETIERITLVARNSIERWTLDEMLGVFSEIVDGSLSGKIKQIYEYRNWVAHGKNPDRLPSAATDPKIVQMTLVDFILQAKQAVLPPT